MSRKLYMGNLPREVGETALQELFARAGSVESVKVMRAESRARAAHRRRRTIAVTARREIAEFKVIHIDQSTMESLE